MNVMVLDPTMSFPPVWRLMEIPEMVAPGPSGVKTVPSIKTVDAVRAAVNVRLPIVKVFELDICARTSIVLDPTTSFPSGWRLTEVPDITVPGPPGTKLALSIATADADDTVVNVRPSKVNAPGDGVCAAKLIVLDPRTKLPSGFSLTGVPDMTVPAPPGRMSIPPITTEDADGTAAKVKPSTIRMLDAGILGDRFLVDASFIKLGIRKLDAPTNRFPDLPREIEVPEIVIGALPAIRLVPPILNPVGFALNV